MKKNWIKKNIILFICMFLIMIISLLTMYNSKYINPLYSNHFCKQASWYFISFIILLFLKRYKFLFKYSFIIYCFNVLLLLLVLFLGNEINGARAWFTFKGLSIQPSELMKLSYSLYLTKILNDYKFKNMKFEFLFLLKILIIFLIPSILIFLEPDTGAIIFLIVITISMLFVSNIKKIWISIILILIFVLVTLFFYLYFYNSDLLIKLIGTSFFYRMDRILNLKNNMQLNNALLSIGNGGLFGSGIGKKVIYIPEAATDFALSVTISSFGFITTFILLLSYFIMDVYFINAIFRTKNKTTKLFVSGFISIFIFSQLYNIFMNIGILPIMGIVLPMLSYGGSSLIIFMIYISIILRLDTNNI